MRSMPKQWLVAVCAVLSCDLLRFAEAALSCAQIVSSYTLLAQEHDHGHNAEPDPQALNAVSLEAGARKRKTQAGFRGYGKYNRSILLFCTKIKLDGHQHRFLEWITIESDIKRQECRACQPLFRAFFQNCKKAFSDNARRKPTPRKLPTQAEQAEGGADAAPKLEEKHTLPELEPHLEVIDAAVRLFSAIERDAAIADESFIAVNRLLEVLQASEGRSVRERSYFGILSAYIAAVFSGHTIKPAVVEDDGQASEEPKEELKLDELF